MSTLKHSHPPSHCHRCGGTLSPDDSLVFDAEAPASPEDAVRAAQGFSYASRPAAIHARCAERHQALLTQAEVEKDLRARVA